MKDADDLADAIDSNVVSWTNGGYDRCVKLIATVLDSPAETEARADLCRFQGSLQHIVEPVRSWFDGDGEIPRPTDLEIASSAVNELLLDRDMLNRLWQAVRLADVAHGDCSAAMACRWCALRSDIDLREDARREFITPAKEGPSGGKQP